MRLAPRQFGQNEPKIKEEYNVFNEQCILQKGRKHLYLRGYQTGIVEVRGKHTLTKLLTALVEIYFFLQ